MSLNRTKFSRRGVLGAAGATGATLTLAGCAGGDLSAGGDGGEGQESDGPLQFWSNHPGSSKATEQEIIDAWNAENPDHQATLVDGGANYEELGQKFNAALAGGQLPDVIVLSDVTWFNFALNEATAPLNDLWEEAGVDPDSFVGTLRDDYKYNDKHYGMPYARSTCLMYLYPSVLEAAGLPTDRGPETWEEFAEWAAKVKETSDMPLLVIPDGTNYLDWYFQGMIWTFGGKFSEEWEPKFTDAAAIEAGEFLKEQYKLGHITTTKDAPNAFAIGEAAGLLESTGVMGGLNESAKEDYIAAFLPGPPPGCPTGGAGVAVPAGISKERQLIAVKFIDFMTNMANTIKFSQATGYMPVREGAIDDPEEKKFLEENPNFTVALEQLNTNTQPQDYARVFVPGGGQRIGAALDKITVGQEDVATVFQALADETKTVVERDIEPLL